MILNPEFEIINQFINTLKQRNKFHKRYLLVLSLGLIHATILNKVFDFLFDKSSENNKKKDEEEGSEYFYLKESYFYLKESYFLFLTLIRLFVMLTGFWYVQKNSKHFSFEEWIDFSKRLV